LREVLTKFSQYTLERKLGKHKRGWEDNVEMDLKQVGLKDLDWVHLAQDKDHWRDLVETVMNFRIP
jgi:hypothetical protein